MDRLADPVVAAEGEGEVGDPAAHQGKGAALLDEAGRLDEVSGVVGVLLDAGADGQDVRVEDDVLGREVDPFGEKRVGALTDLHLAVDAVGLALLVEGHHHHARSVSAQQPRLGQEILLALLERKRVDDPLPLDACEARLQHRPLGAVDHDRDAGDLGLHRDPVQEPGHAPLRVEQPLVHVDVEDVGAAAHLLQRHLRCGVEVPGLDQLAESGGSRDVGPLPDHQEVRIFPDGEGLEAAVAGGSIGLGKPAGGDPGHRSRDGPDVLRRGAAAAAHQIHQAALGELPEQLRRRLRLLVELAEGIGKAGVGIRGDEGGTDLAQLRDVGADLVCSERAVDAHREGVRVGDGAPEGIHGLPGEGAPAGLGDGHRDHDRQPPPDLLVDLVDRDEGGLGVQGVEDRLDQEEVHAAFDQSPGLLGIGVAKLLEGDGAEGRVVHVRSDREGLRGRPQGTRHEAGLLRGPAAPAPGGGPGDARGRQIQLVGQSR